METHIVFYSRLFGMSLSYYIFRIGTFFAPLIPVVGILKLFILFYIKKVRLCFVIQHYSAIT